MSPRKPKLTPVKSDVTPTPTVPPGVIPGSPEFQEWAEGFMAEQQTRADGKRREAAKLIKRREDKVGEINRVVREHRTNLLIPSGLDDATVERRRKRILRAGRHEDFAARAKARYDAYNAGITKTFDALEREAMQAEGMASWAQEILGGSIEEEEVDPLDALFEEEAPPNGV